MPEFQLMSHKSSEDSIGSSITSDLESISLSSLLMDLKREISVKEDVLKVRKLANDNLEQNLTDCKRKLLHMESDSQALNRTVAELRESLKMLQNEKIEYEKQINEKNKMVSVETARIIILMFRRYNTQNFNMLLMVLRSRRGLTASSSSASAAFYLT